jgi:hypothetical protein
MLEQVSENASDYVWRLWSGGHRQKAIDALGTMNPFLAALVAVHIHSHLGDVEQKKFRGMLHTLCTD